MLFRSRKMKNLHLRGGAFDAMPTRREIRMILDFSLEEFKCETCCASKDDRMVWQAASKKLAQPSVEDKGPEYANLEVSGLPMSKMFKEAVRIAFAVRPPHLHRKTNKNRRDKCVLLGLATYLLWKKDAMEQVVRSNVPDTFPFKDEIERKEEIVDIDEIDCNNDDFKEKAAEDFSAQTAHAVLKRAAAAAVTAEERVDSNFDYVQEFESESSPYA